MSTNERVPFRLIQMPCCGYLFCSVNPRLPSYCIECGKPAFAAIKTNPSCILVKDDNAELRYTP